MRILQNIVSIGLCLLAVCGMKAQTIAFSNTYKPGATLYVSTASGIVLRAKADPAGTQIEVLPYGREVVVQPNASPSVAFTNNNIKGVWVKVKAGDKEGFVFDGYLSRYIPIELPKKGRGVELSDYLRANFKTKSESNKGDDSSAVEYLKIIFQNGIVYESKLSEGGYTETTRIPVSVYTFQEVYLLARVRYDYILATPRCAYKEDLMTCDNEEELSVVTIEKSGLYYIVTRSTAD